MKLQVALLSEQNSRRAFVGALIPGKYVSSWSTEYFDSVSDFVVTVPLSSKEAEVVTALTVRWAANVLFYAFAVQENASAMPNKQDLVIGYF